VARERAPERVREYRRKRPSSRATYLRRQLTQTGEVYGIGPGVLLRGVPAVGQIGQPVRRYTVIPLEEPVSPTNEPVTPPPPKAPSPTPPVTKPEPQPVP
jgi:hypothetical protein